MTVETDTACPDCGEYPEDFARCQVGYCEERGCSCRIAPIDLCHREPLDGHLACPEHTPEHRGCPDCDPVMPWE